MGSNPINLALRFLLEISGLFTLGYWGWSRADGVLRFVLALGLPLMAALLWGIFNVKDDPSRSGKAPVPVPGIVRLIIELAFFTLAVFCLFSLGKTTFGWVLGALLIIHYLLSYDRVLWLLRQ